MKKVLLSLLMMIFGFVSSVRAENEEAVTFVNHLTDNVISDVLESKESEAEKEAHFKKYFTEALDLKFIGRFVLGKYARSIPDAKRQEFITTFMDATTHSWSKRFALYNGQEIKFYGTRPVGKSKNQLYVDSKIMNNDAPVEVIWRVKKYKNGEYKIVDIIVENVSMALNYRNEYSSYLQANGGKIDGLIEKLKNQKDAPDEKVEK